MLTLDADSTIYVLCPARIVTGGPEAVHQLVHKLKTFGHDARIIPVPDVPNPALLQYRNYRVAFDRQIVDEARNVLITTEVNPRALDRFAFIQKVIWWLSVDNHQRLAERFDFTAPDANSVLHLAQSAYARDFLRRQGIRNPQMLSDHLNALYLRPQGPLRRQARSRRILYTPVKGADAVVRRLQQADPGLEWLPLTGLTKKQHAQTMRQGTLYVDFGSHPGKDRQPREAAVNGCCLIVGLTGSAAFADDLPIPPRYKFDPGPGNDTAILAAIRRCLSDPEGCRQDIAAYVARIRQEERTFEREVEAIFGLKRLDREPRPITIGRNILLFAAQNDGFTLMRALLNEFVPPRVTAFVKRRYLALRSSGSG